jgi:hypothetical protein
MSFFNLPNPSSRTKSLGLLSASHSNDYQEQKNMFVGSRTRPVRKADNLTAICEPIV